MKVSFVIKNVCVVTVRISIYFFVQYPRVSGYCVQRFPMYNNENNILFIFGATTVTTSSTTSSNLYESFHFNPHLITN